MPVKWRLSRRFVIFSVFLIFSWSGVIWYYNATRGRIVARIRQGRIDRLNGKVTNIGSEIDGGTRAILAESREFLLDYPDADDAGVRMTVAMADAASANPDWKFVADTVENAALRVVNGTKGDPSLARFTSANFAYETSEEPSVRGVGRHGSEWPLPYVLTDVDGDGTKDVVLTTPTESPGVCLLLRHTRSGWVSNRLAVGLPVKSIWTFPISHKGPVAIVLASLAGSEYDPNLLFDVFVWQNGRVKSVLCTHIPHGWQWDHRDTDGSGNQTIRLVARSAAPGWSGSDPHYNILYRWNGEMYTQVSAGKPSRHSDPMLKAGIEQFCAGRFAEAVAALTASLKGPAADSEDLSSERSVGEYTLGLALALQNDYKGARGAMTAAIKGADSDPSKTKEDSLLEDGAVSIPAMAKRFLKYSLAPDSLADGLESVGQGLRLLELLGSDALPGATPKDLISAAHLHLGINREASLTGASVPEQITEVAWTGGSAVLAWKHESSKWRFYVLAYGVEERPTKVYSFYRLPTDLWLYLPNGPVLQLWPIASHVKFAGIKSGSLPEVQISGESGADNVSGTIHWNGSEFLAVQTGDNPEHFLEDLREIESRLFEQRKFQASLDELNSVERQVENSALSEVDQADLLHEIYYHQAVCYRKLGDLRHAETILSALRHSDPDSPWGNLAGSWLGGTGLPGAPIRFEIQIPWRLPMTTADQMQR